MIFMAYSRLIYIKKYLEFCKTFGLKQLIKSPTRVTPNSSTLIDHILTNTDEKLHNVD